MLSFKCSAIPTATVALALLAGPQPLAAAPEIQYTVTLRDQAPYFEPRRLRVEPGAAVVWENRGPALVHTILMVTTDGEVRSGSILPGQSWRHAFTGEADTIVRASCEVHPYMYGMVVVGDPPDELIAAVEAAEVAPVQDALPARILEFELPVPDSVPGILDVDSDDNVWFTMGGGGLANIHLPTLNKVGRLTLDGDLRVFDLPTEASLPDGLTISDDGSVWVTQYRAGRVTRIDPGARIMEDFEVPTPDSRPTGLAVDARGNLWFNENGADKIAKLSPDGTISEYEIPTPGSRPTGMAIDAAGNVWFAERDTGKLGCLRPDGVFVEHTIPTPRAKPAGVAVDGRGRIFFAERQGNKIGMLEDGLIREFPLPSPDSGPFFPLVDDEGAVWFSELFGDRIGRLDPETGEIVEYDLPTKGGWPGGLAMDSQGNLWFSMQLKNKIGVLVRSAAEPAPPHVMPSESSPTVAGAAAAKEARTLAPSNPP